MKIKEFLNNPEKINSKTMDFISRNIISPEQAISNEKDVSLEHIMEHLGGTKAELDTFLCKRMIRRNI